MHGGRNYFAVQVHYLIWQDNNFCGHITCSLLLSGQQILMYMLSFRIESIMVSISTRLPPTHAYYTHTAAKVNLSTRVL